MNSSKDIRVLVVAPSRNTRGGITSVVQSYTQTFLWEKWRCVWIETHIDKTALHKIYFFLRAFFRYMALLPKFRIVHIHFSEPVSAIRKLFFFQAARFWGKRTILHFHSFSIDTTLNGKFAWLYRYMFTRADMVIALSPYWKKCIEDSYPGISRVEVLYNPYNEKPKPPAIEKKKEILFAGTLNARKGYSDLIRAFGRISEQLPDWSLAFAGNGEIDKALGLARSLDIEKKITFHGWISGNRKDEVFRQASLFCLPSYAEGFPMAVIDAVSYGLPVVTTPVGGILDVFEDGRDVLIAHPGNLDYLAAKLREAMTDPELRHRLSNNSMEILEKNFKLETIARKLDNMYAALA